MSALCLDWARTRAFVPMPLCIAVGVGLTSVACLGVDGGTQPPGVTVREQRAETGPGPCSGDRFPTTLGDAEQCCQLGDQTWHRAPPDAANPGRIIVSTYAPDPDNPGDFLRCRLPDNSTACGIGSARCTLGPCGGQRTPLGGNSDGVVFAPSPDATVCGWDGDGLGDGPDFSPVPWDGNTASLYPGVVNTCPYSQCLPGGIPVVDLRVTAVADGATAALVSAPGGISLTGPGVGQWGWDVGTEVTLTATGPACATFTGDCVTTGPATCSLTMDPARKRPFANDVTVTYEPDSAPPSIAAAVAAPAELWPPSHQMVPVGVSVDASDDCDAAPACRIVSVSSSEPADGAGDGHTSSDWQVTGDLAVSLRAERSGGGSGRTYAIEVACTDASGNTSTAVASVVVPHDRRH